MGGVDGNYVPLAALQSVLNAREEESQGEGAAER